jgi:hypothetical protein
MSVFHEIDVNGLHILTKVADITDETHRGSIDKGRMVYSLSDEAVYYGTASAWVKLPSVFDIFPQHTKVLMASYPLPPGFEVWVEASWDSEIIMFTSNLDLVGSVPGTSDWEITGLQSGGQHYHGNKTGRPTVTSTVGKSEIYGVGSSITHRHNIQMSTSHFHSFDGSWQPVHTHYLPVSYIGT